MYLAPLNYDRFFKKIFSDKQIAKQFLEDFLEVTITSIERLPVQQRVTDEAAVVEFDYRCKIDGAYVIIDMQQWYKPDIVQRFYLYHALNSGLQLESLPQTVYIYNRVAQTMMEARDYRRLEPVLTLIWLVDDTLSFKEDYVAYTMAPELVLKFIENGELWHNPTIKKLQQERERVLTVVQNKSKDLAFLRRNRLVFMLQKNIVKQREGQRYERWFEFAEKSRQTENESIDFDDFRGDDVFEKMIRRLKKEALTEDDLIYIATEQEMWEKAAYIREEGIEEGIEIGREEGEQLKSREIAQKLLTFLDNQAIAQATGLTAVEIQQMRRSIV